MPRDATNLASEFCVLSILHRLSANATLTLANKKAVDIVVVIGTGKAVTLDVKGTSGKTGWFVDNVNTKSGHFVVFVSYLGRIEDLSVSPEIYIVPSDEVEHLAITHPSGKKVVHFTRLRSEGKQFRDAWHLLDLDA